MAAVYEDVVGRQHWKLSRTSCSDGNDYAWLVCRFFEADGKLSEGGWEMVGCTCHHKPPNKAIITSDLEGRDASLEAIRKELAIGLSQLTSAHPEWYTIAAVGQSTTSLADILTARLAVMPRS